MRDERRRTTHPNSPVQPGPGISTWIWFVLVAWILAAGLLFQQWEKEKAEAEIIEHCRTFHCEPRSAVGDVRSLIRDDDYPEDALERNQQGSVRAQLSIDKDGRVDGCAIVESSNVASLDAATCKALRRARFEPARDATGRAARGTYFAPRVKWVIAE